MDYRISIVVPIFKIPEEYLRKCLDSLINQTYRELEIILVDDGSPDRDGEICDAYAARDRRIVVIHQENQGVSVARNAGIDVATGEYLMFVDPDDWLEGDCCERLVKILGERPWEVVFFQRCYEEPQGTRYFPSVDSFAMDKEDIREIQLSALAAEHPSAGFEVAAPWGKIIQRELVERHRLRFISGVKRSQDVLFNLELYDQLSEAYYCKYVGYHYRKNDGSICQRYNPEMPSNILGMLHRAAVFVEKNHGGDEAYACALGRRCITALGGFEVSLFFHPESKLSCREACGILKDYLNDNVVKRYRSHCRMRDFAALRGKFRYILLQNRWLGVYYFVMKLARKVIRN